MSERANRSAFPLYQSDRVTPLDDGLTKREWFAGLAMQAVLQAWTADHAMGDDEAEPIIKGDRDLAVYAYQIADAMIAAGKESQ